MHASNNVVFKIDFFVIVKEVIFGNLSIDKRIDEVEQVKQIYKDQSINIYCKCFKINS